MSDILADFKYRKSLVQNLNHKDAKLRLSGFIQWLQKQSITKSIIEKLKSGIDAEAILQNSGYYNPPKASTLEEIAAIGVQLILKCADGEEPWTFSHKYGIDPSYQTDSVQDHFNEVMNRFIDPAIDYIERELESKAPNDEILDPTSIKYEIQSQYPVEIRESLERLKCDYPDFRRNAFVMMRFGKTRGHNEIINSIKSSLEKYSINALRADDKQYHDDLFQNVLTYIYGCHFGIAVFERLEEDDFNPNISLEVGYMQALKKSVCLLKDKTLKTLHTDLVSKLYKTFDPQDPMATIPNELEKWLRDKDIITI